MSAPPFIPSAQFTRREALRTVALVLGSTALPCAPGRSRALAQADRPKPATAPPPITSTALGEKLSLIAGGGGNIAVLGGDDGALVIDSGLADQAAGTLSEVSKAGPLALLVNTHWHFDHAGGNERLARAGARIMAHENCRKRLSSEQFIEALNMKRPAAPPTARPLVTFASETRLHLNGDDIRLVPVPPAHTDGDVIARFEKANLLHAGDLFFHGMYPFIDYSSGGWIGGMVAAAKTMLAMTDGKTRIIPGHGPLATQDDLNAYLSFLETLHQRLIKLKEAGKSVDDAVAAAPTKDFDEKLGKGFLKPEQFVRIAYAGLLKHS